MRLGIRLLFVFFLLNGLAAFFVLRVFSAEIKPSVREVMEDMMVDTANILAELAADDLQSGHIADGHFAQQVNNYAERPINANIWGVAKQSLDFRVYVTDVTGRVLFDSSNTALGQDYSQWRDVARTLRGEYGARATREVVTDARTSVMYVAAPVMQGQAIIGVLTVAKPISTIQDFIDRAERKVLLEGLLLLGISGAVGVAVTLWVVWSIRRLRAYAQRTQAGEKPALPKLSGELGDLALAMEAMRLRLEGRDYIEDYVRALTHELKSPIAAIRASGELLADPLPRADRERFAAQVQAQADRLQRLVERLMALAKLEHGQPSVAVACGLAAPLGRSMSSGTAADGQNQNQNQSLSPSLSPSPSPGPSPSPSPTARLSACVDAALAQRADSFAIKNIATNRLSTWTFDQFDVFFDQELVILALCNLLDNAIDFSPPAGTVTVRLWDDNGRPCVSVIDAGVGVPDYALTRLGERFFTTARPGGERTGTGLGLAITRQIMSLLGGHIRFVQRQPGLQVDLVFAA